MDLLMEEEVRELAGERSKRQPERTASRWGSEQGYCVVMGQKVPIQRPRVRTVEDKEVRGVSRDRWSSGGPAEATVLTALATWPRGKISFVRIDAGETDVFPAPVQSRSVRERIHQP